MKQLHRQASLSKQHRAHHRTRSLASYLVREHRLLFVLLGFLLASSFFLLYPSLAPHPSSLSAASSARDADGAVTRNPRAFFSTTAANNAAVAAARRLPVGVRKKPLRVVVTGGAGFVGSHLVDRLLARGDSVIVVDNFFTGRKDNLAHHLANPRFELIRHDVVEPILLEVDQIYHLACPASPVHYKFNPIKTIKTNVMGTLNMLGLAKRVGARFLLTSTSEVYGDPLEHPQKESYWGHVNPIGVRSCYDEGKRTAETLTMDYHRGAGVEVKLHL
ncbi:UDP-glucuronic acid decarboxylase 1-like [Lolium rigidum]|uniref:UDP-glucuronic acid decarboxylase 1-like n=1 Tax=Lolium rigidum TaxID=89674 RepID=UPI001F5E20B9|nr:UDP-glucuronic acid decarboxylase 1-like [Lolium rigidum]